MVLPEEFFGSAILWLFQWILSVAGAFGYYFTYLCVKVDLGS